LDIKTEVMTLTGVLTVPLAKDGRLEIWDLKKKNMLDPFY